jgi:hypothetical protein
MRRTLHGHIVIWVKTKAGTTKIKPHTFHFTCEYYNNLPKHLRDPTDEGMGLFRASDELGDAVTPDLYARRWYVKKSTQSDANVIVWVVKGRVQKNPRVMWERPRVKTTWVIKFIPVTPKPRRIG